MNLNLLETVRILKSNLKRPPTLGELAVQLFETDSAATKRKISSIAKKSGIELADLLCVDSKQYKLVPQVKVTFKKLLRRLGRNPTPSEMIDQLRAEFDLSVDHQMLIKILKNIRDTYRGKRKDLWATIPVAFQYSDREIEEAYAKAQTNLYKKYPGRLRMYPTSTQVAETIESRGAEKESVARVIQDRITSSLFMESRQRRGLKQLQLATADLTLVAALFKGLRILGYKHRPIVLTQLATVCQGLLGEQKINNINDYLSSTILTINGGHRFQIPASTGKERVEVIRERPYGLYNHILSDIYNSLKAPSGNVCQAELSAVVQARFPSVNSDSLSGYLQKLNLKPLQLRPITFWVREELLLLKDTNSPIVVEEITDKVKKRIRPSECSVRDVNNSLIILRRQRPKESEFLQTKAVPINFSNGLPAYFAKSYRKKIIPEVCSIPLIRGMSHRPANLQDIEAVNLWRIKNGIQPFIYFSNQHCSGRRLASVYRISEGIGSSFVDLSIRRDRELLQNELSELANQVRFVPDLPELYPISKANRPNFEFSLRCWKYLILISSFQAKDLDSFHSDSFLNQWSERLNENDHMHRLRLKLIDYGLRLGFIQRKTLDQPGVANQSSDTAELKERICRVFDQAVDRILPLRLSDYFDRFADKK